MITPIYRELSRKLEDYIMENNLSGRLPGLVPLCRRFGVHQATMTKAVHILRDKGLLRIEGTRGTFVNRDDLRQRPVYHMIGLIGFNHLVIRDSVLNNLNPLAEKSGYQLLSIAFHPSLYLKNRDIFSQFPVDGLIFCYSTLTKQVAERLRHEEIPMVSCNRRPDLPWLDSVDYDHRREFQQVLNYLRKLGHRRIARLEYCRSSDYHSHLELVQNIFMEEMGNDYDPALFHVAELPENIRKQTGQDSVTRFVRNTVNYYFNLDSPPSAILCPQWAADELSNQLKQLGLRIPGDVSLICSTSNYGYNPFYTSLVHDEDRLLKTALQRMLQLLAGGNDGKPEFLTIQGQLKQGTTSGSISPSISINKKQELTL